MAQGSASNATGVYDIDAAPFLRTLVVPRSLASIVFCGIRDGNWRAVVEAAYRRQLTAEIEATPHDNGVKNVMHAYYVGVYNLFAASHYWPMPTTAQCGDWSNSPQLEEFDRVFERDRPTPSRRRTLRG
ncbi:hypothetical protein GXW78_16980 [Roseomonas terrae]|uniref:Uncharacterized protein n=1 Tax=Neoroseomonas terrae TaxID=424799 RepID=A0ABS5EK21_9PROT|nr:hypothetical protein [Neoroseomonas terrae]MBR0651370.1 hypothetical protein [Neoroseomonas terrae]